ncbi:ABC transporter permease [Gordonia sp. CPCC 205515]|uniref:ABC transporter permease n=1 Tax=Gordonia sp. CPCC 205515 TaxID=3140791 RepID=UPI003AF3CD4C
MSTAVPTIRPLDAAGRPGAIERSVAGFPVLLRLAFRRERVIAPVTVVLFVLTDLATAASVSSMYGDAAARTGLQAGVGANAAFNFLLGELVHTEPLAAVVAWRAGLFMIAALGVCAAIMTVRQTRKEEELGRTELMRAGAVGPLAPLVAGAIVAVVFTIVVALGMSLILLPYGAAAGDVAAVFAQYAATGVAGVGIALVAAQIATTSHIANLAATSVMLVGYLLRGAADAIGGWGWLRWCSPVGWAELIDPFGANNGWPAMLSPAVFVVGAVAAGWVAVHRDYGAGLIAPRQGPPASARLGGIEALAARLLSPVLRSWVGGLFFYAAVVGFMRPSVGDLAEGNAMFAQVVRGTLGGATLSTLFSMTMISFLAVACSGFAVNVSERLRAEEEAARAETLLATPTSRSRYFGAYLTIAVLGTVIALLGVGIGMVLGCGVAGGGWATPAGETAKSVAVQVPATLVMVTLAVALYAVRPVLVHMGWIAVVLAFFLGPLSGLFNLPQWVEDLSPFTHTPMVPVEPMRWLTVVVMLCVAAVFAIVGWWAFRRRDVG